MQPTVAITLLLATLAASKSTQVSDSTSDLTKRQRGAFGPPRGRPQQQQFPQQFPQQQQQQQQRPQRPQQQQQQQGVLTPEEQWGPPIVFLEKCQGLDNRYPNGYNPGVGPTSCDQLFDDPDCNSTGTGFVCGPDYDHVQQCYQGQVYNATYQICTSALSCATGIFGDYAGCLIG